MALQIQSQATPLECGRLDEFPVPARRLPVRAAARPLLLGSRVPRGGGGASPPAPAASLAGGGAGGGRTT